MIHDQPLCIPEDHPAFAGHFPGQPIVPGVVLLDLAQIAIQQACACTLTELAVAKFYRPVRPGEAATLSAEPDATGIRFVIRVGDVKVADGKFLGTGLPLP
ncbi:hypothetical protein [Leeia oryzae]|uniref:hypothetical protein n=1 Tax=Leeia oryzae TaxID=356662 RepID=UPI00036F3C89|nr:hypothetical protein [Leeia oryzae]